MCHKMYKFIIVMLHKYVLTKMVTAAYPLYGVDTFTGIYIIPCITIGYYVLRLNLVCHPFIDVQ